jgi:hypothetical protein
MVGSRHEEKGNVAKETKRPTVKRGRMKKTVRGRIVRTGRTVRRSQGREAGRKTRQYKQQRQLRKR